MCVYWIGNIGLVLFGGDGVCELFVLSHAKAVLLYNFEQLVVKPRKAVFEISQKLGSFHAVVLLDCKGVAFVGLFAFLDLAQLLHLGGGAALREVAAREQVCDLQFVPVELVAVVEVGEEEVDRAEKFSAAERHALKAVKAVLFELEHLLVDGLVLRIDHLPHAEAHFLLGLAAGGFPEQLCPEEYVVGFGGVELDPEDALRLDPFPLLLVYYLKPAWLSVYLWVRKEKLPSRWVAGSSLASLDLGMWGLLRGKGKAWVVVLFLVVAWREKAMQ